MSSLPDPVSHRSALHSRIFSLCLFSTAVATAMVAMIIGTYELLNYVVELVNLGYLAQAAVLMGIALFGAILFGAVANERAGDVVDGCESFTARTFALMRSFRS